MHSLSVSTVSSLLLLTSSVRALDVDFSSSQSINNAAKSIAFNIISLYDKGVSSSGIPGLFPSPYFWWESGLAFDSLINYWFLTGDDTYNDRVSKGLLWQIGDANDYMPVNQTKSLGNDDQSTWALACMTAAERGFPDPPTSSGVDSWLQLAQNVFDSQVLRWENSSCGGGLRWQIFSFNNGYDYKNTMTNGNFMQLAARLAHYTGNQTYSDWALRASQWAFDVGLISNGSFNVYDGASTGNNCRQPNRVQFTASLGTYLSGYAYMYNTTSTQQWNSDISNIFVNAIDTFASTPNGILTEVSCASHNTCNVDQLAFRAILARALANANELVTGANLTTVVDNGSQNEFDATPSSVLRASAEGAAAQCSGGDKGTTCGSDWASTKWDGTQGLGQDLSALEIILANLQSKAVRKENGTSTTSTTGGSSTSTSGGATTTATGNGANSHSMSIIGLLAAFCLAIAFSA